MKSEEILMATFIFNSTGAAGAGSEIVQPRLMNVKLVEVSLNGEAPLIAPKVNESGARNKAQQDKINELLQNKLDQLPPYQLLPIYFGEPGNTLYNMFKSSLNWSYRCYEVTATDPLDNTKPATTVDGQRVFQDYIYLFNVIVAFEWTPSKYNIAMLERAARRAADFLFDVTNGWMTFGQVVIGGPELLHCADIQIMASNRFLARSWVGGLHEPTKYMPIRLGRGNWQKNTRGSIPWDEPEGYRTLVHEWAHYALELLDDYVERHEVYVRDELNATQGTTEARRSNRTVLVPAISQPVESIMSTLEGTSELTAKEGSRSQQRKQAEWDVLANGFKGVDGKQIRRFPRIKLPVLDIEGPLPLPELPNIVWFETDAYATAAEAWADELLLLRSAISPVVSLEHCWVYVLKKYGADPIPSRILAQGTLDRLVDDGFRLFGAAEEDQLVLIGNDGNWKTRILRATIPTELPKRKEDDRKEIQDLIWYDVTPDPFPVITAHPEVVDPEKPIADLRAFPVVVQIKKADGMLISDGELPVYVFPLDQVVSPTSERIAIKNNKSTIASIALDGHIYAEIDGKIIIATYSQGGGPTTGSPTGGTPITPGSSEGNLLVFFDDRGEYPDYNKHHQQIKVVTTRWPGSGEGTSKSADIDARGYAYSLCANTILPSEYLPTLALSYDKRAELRDGEAIIHRLDDTGKWQPITSYRPSGAWYVAAPLTIKTAPRLFDPDLNGEAGRVEHFRLFWVPPEAVGESAAQANPK
jgi:hypothetical protein